MQTTRRDTRVACYISGCRRNCVSAIHEGTAGSDCPVPRTISGCCAEGGCAIEEFNSAVGLSRSGKGWGCVAGHIVSIGNSRVRCSAHVRGGGRSRSSIVDGDG